MPHRTPYLSYFQIGLFVLVSLGLACTVTLLLGLEQFFTSTDTYCTFFIKIPRSLQVDSFVYVDGIKMGRVSRLRRVTGTNQQHWIRAELRLHGVDDLLLTNRQVQVSEPLIAGPASLLIVEPVPPDDPNYAIQAPTVDIDLIVDPECYIPAQSETKRASFEQKIELLLNNLNNFLSDDTGQRIATALDSVTQTLAVVNHTLLDPRLQQAVDALCTTLIDVAQLVSNVTDHVDVRTLGSTVEALNRAAHAGAILCERLEGVLQSERLNTLAHSLEQVAATGAPALEDVRALVVDLRALAATLTSVAEGVERNPSSLLLGAPAPKATAPGELP